MLTRVEVLEKMLREKLGVKLVQLEAIVIVEVLVVSVVVDSSSNNHLVDCRAGTRI